MLTVTLLCLLSAEQNLKEVYKEMSTQSTSLTFSTYSAGRSGHKANAHLFVSFEESLLVDTGGSANDTAKIIEMVKRAGKKLTSVFLTSANGDQTSGIERVHEAFPSARFYSTREIAAALGPRFVKIETRAELTLGKDPIAVLPLMLASDKPCAALHISTLSVLAGGCTWNGDFSFAGIDAQQAKSAFSALQKVEAATLLPNYGDGGPGATILSALQLKLQSH
jgi:hypothetical protein